jgi:hypothetical protein
MIYGNIITSGHAGRLRARFMKILKKAGGFSSHRCGSRKLDQDSRYREIRGL